VKFARALIGAPLQRLRQYTPSSGVDPVTAAPLSAIVTSACASNRGSGLPATNSSAGWQGSTSLFAGVGAAKMPQKSTISHTSIERIKQPLMFLDGCRRVGVYSGMYRTYFRTEAV
jgi:hypothetical protein